MSEAVFHYVVGILLGLITTITGFVGRDIYNRVRDLEVKVDETALHLAEIGEQSKHNGEQLQYIRTRVDELSRRKGI